MQQPTEQPRKQADLVLTERQQYASAVVLVFCLAVMLANWGVRWLRGDRMIDIERPFERKSIELMLDLNQASWPELTLLPEISETMARRVVEYRDVQGPFESLEQLKQVRGIGPRTFEQVLPYLKPIAPIPATVSHGGAQRPN